ncbi:PQQ-dependent sugar dehydrogenase [Acuticoccus sp.]|uniref:PQQ-dependent sugar dehydrogenase n=1 Tax=Acuticoccus sp. TaxID=1904378 RepID=UPI003B523BCA
MLRALTSALFATTMLTLPTLAQTAAPAPASSPTSSDAAEPGAAARTTDAGKAAASSSRDDQEIGKTFTVRPEELPEPYATPAVRNPAVTLERGSSKPTAPEGFAVTLFAEGLKPRQVLVMDDGAVIVAEQSTGKLKYLRDTDDDGEADIVQLFAQDFEGPYGLAQDGMDVLVADTRGIWRVPTSGKDAVRAGGKLIHGTSKASETPEAERRPQRPMDHFAVTDQGVFGGSNGHSTRSLHRDAETGELTVGVGSAGNIGIEPPMRATIQRFDGDGSNQRTVVIGVRNPIGLDAHPETGQLWAAVQERDGLGDGLVPDFLIPVEDGADYGYPHAYTGSNPQPDFADRDPARVEASQVPPVLFEPHSAAMSFSFYDGSTFPEEYRGDALVALKGSWNRADPTGYKVVRVHFEDGQPTGSYENFLTGFWVSGDERAEVWGRPVDVDVLPSGAILVTDDTGGTIWHVAYQGRQGA